MTSHNSSILPIVDYELTYVENGKRVKINGKAKARLDVFTEYQDIHYRDSYPLSTFKTSSESRITLDLIVDNDKLYTMKTTNEAKPMEIVKRTVRVDVADLTFESLSNARKFAGAPKTSKFEFVKRASKVNVYAELYSVIFSWKEEV